MICPSCRHENRPAAKFCARCRAGLQRVCPECGTEVAPEDLFCDACGADLPGAATATASVNPPSLEAQFAALQEAMPAAFRDRILTQAEGELRVVTVLFADMSRSVETTRHLPPDEAAALINRLLRAMVDALLKYEGRVDHFLGDGALAVFGAPQAHENDPERAILAAMAIREAARQLGLQVTAGINTGEVYLGGIGSERHQEVTVMGPVVSLASRLQGQAEPDEIVVGEATYRQTRRAFEFTPRTLAIKGIDGPVSAYQALRPLSRPEKVRGIEGLRADLIGRQRELAALIDAAEDLANERRGQIVTVIGEAGIGKTRLVSELKAYLQDKAVLWLEGRCISIGQSVSFWPFIDIMRAYLGIAGEDTEGEIAAKLVQRLTDLFDQDAAGVIPYVGQMLSVKLEEQYQERIRHAAPEQVRRQTLLRVRDLFVALARRQPLALILEDLHWADDLSLDLLWVLMDELVAAPILLVCVYRPEHEHGCWKIDSAASSKHLERYTPLRLKPLTHGESRQMVESLLDIRDLPPATRAAILENTEGNPFFVEEVVRLLIERGTIYREDGLWQANETIGALAVPDTIKSVILSRIDRLHKEVRYALQCASVIGRVFQHRLLEFLSGQSEALEAHLSQLETYELVYKERIVPELEYAFKHALTQETAYEAILSRHRKSFHQRVGAAIEELYQEQIEEYYELLAFHYSRSENREKAIEYLVKAGQKAAGRYANQEALGYYEKALSLAEGSGVYETLLAERAKVRLSLFQGKEAASDYEQLLESARRAHRQNEELTALLGLAKSYYVIALDDQTSDSPSRCRQLYEAAYALAHELGDAASMARAVIPTTWLTDFSSEYKDQAIANARAAISLSHESEDEELVIDSRLAMFRYTRSLPEAQAGGEELRDQLKGRHDFLRLNELYFHLMWGHSSLGRFEKAIEYCDDGIKLAGEIGLPPVQYPTLKALALLKLGHYGEAWEALQAEVADEGHRFGAAMKDLGTSIYFSELMAHDKASEIARSVIEQATTLRRPWMRGWAQMVLARSLIRSGRPAGADLAQITQDPENMGATFPAEVMAEIYLFEGRLEEALQQAERSACQAEETRWLPAYVSTLALKLRILLGLGQPAEVAALADRALPMAEDMHSLPMVWRIRGARAEALALLGNMEAAAHEYHAAASIIQTLAKAIGDAELRQGFVSSPQVSPVLAAANRRPRSGKE
jgi:class 3 adenylate cyclase/tetratricopeptide (TPR) repeat protein